MANPSGSRRKTTSTSTIRSKAVQKTGITGRGNGGRLRKNPKRSQAFSNRAPVNPRPQKPKKPKTTTPSKLKNSAKAKAKKSTTAKVATAKAAQNKPGRPTFINAQKGVQGKVVQHVGSSGTTNVTDKNGNIIAIAHVDVTLTAPTTGQKISMLNVQGNVLKTKIDNAHRLSFDDINEHLGTLTKTHKLKGLVEALTIPQRDFGTAGKHSRIGSKGFYNAVKATSWGKKLINGGRLTAQERSKAAEILNSSPFNLRPGEKHSNIFALTHFDGNTFDLKSLSPQSKKLKDFSLLGQKKIAQIGNGLIPPAATSGKIITSSFLSQAKLNTYETKTVEPTLKKIFGRIGATY